MQALRRFRFPHREHPCNRDTVLGIEVWYSGCTPSMIRQYSLKLDIESSRSE